VADAPNSLRLAEESAKRGQILGREDHATTRKT
jgi:hypothetical protein